jgi:hypothetical protein
MGRKVENVLSEDNLFKERRIFSVVNEMDPRKK